MYFQEIHFTQTRQAHSLKKIRLCIYINTTFGNSLIVPVIARALRTNDKLYTAYTMYCV